jgi:hypothetical protein
MTITRCHLCANDPEVRRLYGSSSLDDGAICPVCHLPVCRYHLTKVRWRWRESGIPDSALICRDCSSSYKHRNWDTLNRDWIS